MGLAFAREGDGTHTCTRSEIWIPPERDGRTTSPAPFPQWKQFEYVRIVGLIDDVWTGGMFEKLRMEQGEGHKSEGLHPRSLFLRIEGASHRIAKIYKLKTREGKIIYTSTGILSEFSMNDERRPRKPC